MSASFPRRSSRLAFKNEDTMRSFVRRIPDSVLQQNPSLSVQAKFSRELSMLLNQHNDPNNRATALEIFKYMILNADTALPIMRHHIPFRETITRKCEDFLAKLSRSPQLEAAIRVVHDMSRRAAESTATN